MARVAILGRPNVGKSTLFNRLAGRRVALVDDRPGVTRDRIEALGEVEGRAVTFVDTAGLEEGEPASLPGRLRRIALDALAVSDMGLFVVDAKSGPTAADHDLAALLRGAGKPIALVANKADSPRDALAAQEAWALGLGEPVAVSAAHGLGFDELDAAILAALPPAPDAPAEPPDAALDDEAGPLKLVIVGRPNAGKSSLVNRLLGEERMLTGPEPGLTRDAVPLDWTHKGRAVTLIDTAGLRRRARINEALDKMSASATTFALKRAHVAVLMIDATQPLEHQDAAIADLIAREGRALVVAANKWDLVEDPKTTRELIRHRLEHRLPQVKGVLIHPMSVRTGRGVDKLLPAVMTAYERWNRRVPTAKLNRWLEETLAAHPPPMAQRRRVKIRYATQIKARPPTFVLFANKAGALADSYLRYLTNGLRAAFDLDGVPIRLRVKAGENPYHGG